MGILPQIIWAIAPGIIVGVFMAWWNRRQRKEDEEKGRRDEERIKIVTTQLSLAVASAQLAYAVAMAYKRGAPNGEMETAVATYEKAIEKFRKFEREQMARNAID